MPAVMQYGAEQGVGSFAAKCASILGVLIKLCLGGKFRVAFGMSPLLRRFDMRLTNAQSRSVGESIVVLLTILLFLVTGLRSFAVTFLPTFSASLRSFRFLRMDDQFSLRACVLARLFRVYSALDDQ